MNNTNNLKFFWNGIKVKGGKLQRASYSGGAYVKLPAGTITIYAMNYDRFSAEIREAFVVENNSDGQTDYFENDIIRVSVAHPLYKEVAKALVARNAHLDKRFPASVDQRAAEYVPVQTNLDVIPMLEEYLRNEKASKDTAFFV